MTLDARRLRRLVRYRDRLQRLQEGELAAQLRLHARREAALAASTGARAQLLDGGPPPIGPVEPLLLASACAYGIRLEQDIAARSAALARSLEDVEAERDALMERRRDRRAMEILLDRRLAADRERRERTAIQSVDEQAAIRWLRRQDTTESPA